MAVDEDEGRFTISDPTALSVAALLAKQSFPEGLYVSMHRMRPDPILGRLGEHLIGYLCLLHDVSILVKEWNRLYEKLVQDHIKDQDYTPIVDSILEKRKAYREAIMCPYCESRDTREVTRWRPRRSTEIKARRKCLGCRKRYTVSIPVSMRGRQPKIIRMSHESLMKESMG